jgi:hypothetical protein
VEDCNNEVGGTAASDECGTCVGGNTGKTAIIWYYDNDADTWGGETIKLCADSPGEKWIDRGGDVNDNCPDRLNKVDQCNVIPCNNNYTTESTRGAPSPETLQKLAKMGNAGGVVIPEELVLEISACKDGTDWVASLTSLKGMHAFETGGWTYITEVTGVGAGGNTEKDNFCEQVSDLLDSRNATKWFMKAATVAHESVHESHISSSLSTAAGRIATYAKGIKVPNTGQSQSEAVTALKSTDGYANLQSNILKIWVAEYLKEAATDHSSGITLRAEHVITMPMIKAICGYSISNGVNWGYCVSCP